jgi:hypothetical protein
MSIPAVQFLLQAFSVNKNGQKTLGRYFRTYNQENIRKTIKDDSQMIMIHLRNFSTI